MTEEIIISLYIQLTGAGMLLGAFIGFLFAFFSKTE